MVSVLQAQVAAVMEVLANAAVAEICAAVERSYRHLHSELLSSRRENSALRRRVRNLEIRDSFCKKTHRLKGPECRGAGRLVRVKIRALDNQHSGDGAETPGASADLIPASTQEEPVDDGDSEVLIIKEERVEAARRKEPDLEQNLGEEQEHHYRVSEDEENFLEQDTVQVGQQERDVERPNFLKEENLEQHVAEEAQETNGDPPEETCSQVETQADLHTSWDSSRFEGTSHSLSYPGPDCSAGTSVNEYYIHGSTGENLCHFGTPMNPLPDVDGHLAHGEQLAGADQVVSQSELPPFEAGFSPQVVKERFVCKFCGKPFASASALILHQRVHTGEKPYYCALCGKRFSQSSSLKKHHSIHLGEKPFRCVHCGKQFSDQSNLRKHVNVHTGEKPYGCSQCGKTFNQSSNLKTHMKIHTREKPFGCERCGQIFAYKNSLARHQQKNCLLQQSPVGQFYPADH